MKEIRKEMRLDKLISSMGYASRSEVKELIKKGIVTIDTVELADIKPQMKVIPGETMVRIHGEIIEYVGDMYAKIYKPKGVRTTDGPRQTESLMDLLDPAFWYMGLFPVGNLALEAEGLVLLVNDGPLAHRLSHPNKQIERTYYASIQGRIRKKDILAFGQGMTFPKYTCGAVKMTVVEQKENEAMVFLKLKERKTTQLIDMFERIGKEIIFLQAHSFGGVYLDDDLGVGETKALTTEEINILMGPGSRAK